MTHLPGGGNVLAWAMDRVAQEDYLLLPSVEYSFISFIALGRMAHLPRAQLMVGTIETMQAYLRWEEEEDEEREYGGDELGEDEDEEANSPKTGSEYPRKSGGRPC